MENERLRENYDSGEDYVLETGEQRFTFNEIDFGQRIEQAARQLDFIEGNLSEEERGILADLTANSAVEIDSSPFVEHLLEHKEQIGTAKDSKNMIHWLKHLVFRGAWLDQRMLEGELEVEFDEDTMDFVYLQKEYSILEHAYKKRRIQPAKVPSWREIAYQPED